MIISSLHLTLPTRVNQDQAKVYFLAQCPQGSRSRAGKNHSTRHHGGCINKAFPVVGHGEFPFRTLLSARNTGEAHLAGHTTMKLDGVGVPGPTSHFFCQVFKGAWKVFCNQICFNIKVLLLKKHSPCGYRIAMAFTRYLMFKEEVIKNTSWNLFA